jgi:hypothetical protein
MTNQEKKRLSAVLRATEYLFLENIALKLVLEHREVPNWQKLLDRLFPKATATSAPPENNSTTADTMLGTVPMSTSGRANVAVGARKKRNAPAHR